MALGRVDPLRADRSALVGRQQAGTESAQRALGRVDVQQLAGEQPAPAVRAARGGEMRLRTATEKLGCQIYGAHSHQGCSSSADPDSLRSAKAQAATHLGQ